MHFCHVLLNAQYSSVNIVVFVFLFRSNCNVNGFLLFGFYCNACNAHLIIL